MKKIISIALLILCFNFCKAQNRIPILERKISIEFSDEKLPGALSLIAQQGKFSFSYNSSIISNDQVVRLKAINKTIREILNEIFRGTITYKEKSNHLILSKVSVKQMQASSLSIVISGYVEDAVTKERIADASVYDKKSITSVVTDEYGFFKIKLDKKDQSASIAISKRDYRDTLVTITAPGNQYLNISIAPIGKDSILVKAVTSSSDSLKKDDLSLPYNDGPNIRNISDTLYRDVQISFLPFLGSNGSLSGNVINDYSINILGGYSLGTKQIELGFFMNLDRGNVSWLQIAGFGNLVGKNVYGIQASGLFNINGGETKAAQLTGLANVNFHDFLGVQAAGFANVNLRAAEGVQVAGFANIATRPSRGVQIAGFANLLTDRFTGPQVAGVANIATKHISGSQIAGLFNYARNVKGTQIGLFNYADTLGGIPIGLVSFVKSGYHKLEFSADEVFYANVAFRTGSPKFYNILLTGFKPEKTINNANVWTFGYGLGFTQRLSRKMQLNFDLTSQHISKGSFTNELSLLNKAHAGVDFRLKGKFSIYTGITLNGYLTHSSFTDYPILFTGYEPSLIADHTYNNGTNLKMWLGAKVGLRFL